ncbi:hypothetical protein CL644_02380 [bacterium]|jgi:putative transposase|nr:hypothetical protein [Parcubacteria group bacterium]MBF05531.1 hypothetical protein [bacterium]
MRKMQRKVPFVEGEYYHVYNRGVERRKIFTSVSDYQRFLLLLLLGNTQQAVRISDLNRHYSAQGRSLRDVFSEEIPQNTLVDVLSYCLMPNHVHLIIREKEDDGISKFMSKVMTGYSMYFNKKYERSGALFQGRFQAKHIDSDFYFRHIFSYIHLNPVDLFKSSWKEDGFIDKKGAINFLNEYGYSSYYDYFIGDRPESSVIVQDDDLPWKDDVQIPEQLFDFYIEE